ncbi:MAG: hypothetical protein IJ041_01965 [Clostridia bacterium]|nr:hypothetical protein [Clostridia bacterium]
MKKILFIFLQCTWGIVQTLIGLGFFIALRKRPHRMYRGCIDTQWNHHGGLSLGLFIFTPPDEQQNADLIRVHEYGHAVQSLVLGPLMLFVGIISVLWGNLPYFARRRRTRHLPYTACFVEAWASRWGERATGQKAIWE